MLSKRSSKVAAQIAERERERIQDRREKFEGTLSRIRERLRERAQEIEGECGEFFDLANVTFSDVEEDLIDAQQYRGQIQELKQARQECVNSVAKGNLTRARDRLQQLKSDVKAFRWAIRNLIGDEIEDETDAETKGRGEVAEKIRDRIQEIKRIGDEIQAIDEKVAERCTEMVQQMEELENEGEYSKIQNRIKVALQGCTDAQEEVKGKKGKATTSTTKRKGTTTTLEGATTTTMKGGGGQKATTTTMVENVTSTTMGGHERR
jgi:chromosome segregation ATPase